MSPTTKHKVLVVDDEQHNVELVHRILRQDFEVLTGTSGQEGLALLRANPDVVLVISDQRMPGMSGSEFLTEVFNIAPHSMRVLMTAHAEYDAVVEAINFGKIWSYVRKPASPAELRQVVESSLEVYLLTAKNRELTRELEVKNRQLSAQNRLLEMTLDERTRELLEANQKLQEMAIRDGLTGLYNHQYFQERATQEIARAKRYTSPVALLFMDIDHFKAFNDAHGHPEGDRLLQEVAKLLSSNTRTEDIKIHIRDTDLVARYGGEEFVILMPETGKSGGMVAAERLRAAIATHDFAGAETQPTGRVTVSIGVAGFPEDARSKDELILRADRALYEAKKQGRDRIMAA